MLRGEFVGELFVSSLSGGVRKLYFNGHLWDWLASCSPGEAVDQAWIGDGIS
jgi:hypothetical protein